MYSFLTKNRIRVIAVLIIVGLIVFHFADNKVPNYIIFFPKTELNSIQAIYDNTNDKKVIFVKDLSKLSFVDQLKECRKYDNVNIPSVFEDLCVYYRLRTDKEYQKYLNDLRD